MASTPPHNTLLCITIPEMHVKRLFFLYFNISFYRVVISSPHPLTNLRTDLWSRPVVYFTCYTSKSIQDGASATQEKKVLYQVQYNKRRRGASHVGDGYGTTVRPGAEAGAAAGVAAATEELSPATSAVSALPMSPLVLLLVAPAFDTLYLLYIIVPSLRAFVRNQVYLLH